MATSFQKFRIWKENVLEELYRKYQGKTIKDDYGKNSKEFIDFANDMKKSMKINAAKYGLRLITFEMQIPAHLTTHSAKSWSVFPDVTERVSASADQ